jgi:hypothetical protein
MSLSAPQGQITLEVVANWKQLLETASEQIRLRPSSASAFLPILSPCFPSSPYMFFISDFLLLSLFLLGHAVAQMAEELFHKPETRVRFPTT